MFMHIFYNIVIGPIELLTEWIFSFMYSKFPTLDAIGAICGVSFVINFLALPLYNISDALQLKERNIQKKLEFRVKRIKMAFSGDERFMMLSEYYRQNNYHPLYVLRSSLSILIEIPFFIAAYQFLSHCELLQGRSFLFLSDLGKPDALFSIPLGKVIFTVNVLPILMTLINLFSGAVYTKDAPLREKIQLYAMATLFLVLLYNSPSGLVFYWILNNLFSLAKNIIVKMKNPKRIAFGIISASWLLLALYKVISNFRKSMLMGKVSVFLLMAIIFSLLPFFYKLAKRFYIKHILPSKKILRNPKKPFSNFWLLAFSGLALTLIAGFLLPSSVIASSPVEFSFLGKTSSPMPYIYSALSLFFGLFLFWPICVYKMFGKKVQKTESILFVVLLFVVLANVYIFKQDIGTISVLFHLDNPAALKKLSLFLTVGPVAIAILSLIIIFLVYGYQIQRFLTLACMAICIACLAQGIMNTSKIQKSYNAYALSLKSRENVDSTIQPFYHLSKNGKNVLVLFIDRAINSFWPYMLNEFPEMNNQFSGFVYYPNTLSYSTNTVMAAPSLMAGYDYTPEAMNERSDEKLVNKHNEALVTLPKVFLDAGYNVMVTDPPFSNYEWKGNLYPFKKYPEIKVKELEGLYSDMYISSHPNDYKEKHLDETCKKNIKLFSILQMLPPSFRSFFYDNGKYIIHIRLAENDSFTNQYSTLYYLPELTKIDDDNKNNFVFMDNETTHEYIVLKDDYTPGIVENVDSIELKSYPYVNHAKNGGETDFVAYQVNVAALKRLAVWFDYLKENGVYDNTRIIIVADHGRQIPIHAFKDWENSSDYAGYTPLLLVKDFNAKGNPTTDNTFMTNADTPFLAVKDLPVSQKNPFTGNDFEARNHKDNVHIYKCIEFNAFELRKLNQFYYDPNQAYSVSENIFEQDNWQPLSKKSQEKN